MPSAIPVFAHTPELYIALDNVFLSETISVLKAFSVVVALTYVKVCGTVFNFIPRHMMFENTMSASAQIGKLLPFVYYAIYPIYKHVLSQYLCLLNLSMYRQAFVV